MISYLIINEYKISWDWLWTGQQGFDSRQRQDISHLPPSNARALVALYSGVKWMKHGNGCSPPASAVIKDAWTFTPLILYAFIVWCQDTRVTLPVLFNAYKRNKVYKPLCLKFTQRSNSSGIVFVPLLRWLLTEEMIQYL